MTSEYFTEAIVLDKEPFGEIDSRVYLYTKLFGRIAAKVKSARKITSKLSAHLEPLNLVDLRLISGKDYQAVDALKKGRLADVGFLRVLNLVKQTMVENQPDEEVWQILKNQIVSPMPADFAGKLILKNLGFDSQYASCFNCQRANPNIFSFIDAQYLCSSCLVNYNYSNSDVFAI